jgi:hypothetical protein
MPIINARDPSGIGKRKGLLSIGKRKGARLASLERRVPVAASSLTGTSVR